jgi:hypothetical protein
VRVIWAIHDTDPMLDGGELVSMTWHGREHRGVRSLHLLTPPVKNAVSRGHQAQHWDVTLRNVSSDTKNCLNVYDNDRIISQFERTVATV